MERILRTTFAALTALALFTGCRNVEQELPEAPSVKTVRFRAGTTETRTAFAEAVNGVYQTLWTENDSEVLLSLNYAPAEPSGVSASADGKTATFEASFDAAAAKAPYTFYAVSPASAARAISPSRKAWSVYISADQAPSALSVDEDAQLLVAKSAASATLPDEVDLHFSHLTAYGRITLKNLELGEAKVRKAELIFGTPVVGEWYWGEDGTLTSNGASHTITLSTDASGDLWFACAPVSVGNTGMTLDLYTDKGNLRKEITFPEGRSFTSGKVARFSIDMAGIEPAGDSGIYTLVTDSWPLVEGDEIIFLNADGTRAMGIQNGNYRSAVTTGFVLSENQVEVTGTEVATFTVEAGAGSGTWSFKGLDGYLAAPSADKNQLLTQKNKDGHASWSLSFAGNGDATVTAISGTRNLLRYNASSPRFSCYRSGQQAVRLYRKGGVLPVADDPLAASDEYGCYLSGAERTYVKGSDQLRRSYGADGKLVFALLNAGTKEQLVISGYDPSLAKGDEVTVTVSWRKGLHNVLKEQTFRMRVIREDGSKVWLGNGSGQGFIIKK
jgi:hypothetical protein